MMVPVQSLPPIQLGGPLRPNVADLWCFYYEGVAQSELLGQYDALMTEEERARHQKFHFQRDRDMFLATRALVRTVLSNYADLAPAEWRFAKHPHGKPYVVGPAGTPRIEFNLTNTRGLVACVVSGCQQVGVDAERRAHAGDPVSNAHHYLSPLEMCALRALPQAARHDHFLLYWTLKESYLKARGVGLTLPLSQFSFLVDDGAIRVLVDADVADDPGRWRFAALRGSSAHVVAVAADTQGMPFLLRSSSYVPLHGVVPFAVEVGAGHASGSVLGCRKASTASGEPS